MFSSGFVQSYKKVNYKSYVIFLALESKFVQYMTSYMQLSPFKMTFFGMRCFKILMWFPDEYVWWFISVRLLVRIVPSTEHLHLCWANSLYITVSKKRNPACLLLKSFCCACFFHFGVFAVPLWRETDMWFPGQRWMYHSRVLSGLLWTGVHYTELTSRSLWKGMLVVSWLYVLQDVIQQGWSNLLLGRSPGRLVIMVKSLKQEWNCRWCDFQIWKPLLSNNTWRCV